MQKKNKILKGVAKCDSLNKTVSVEVSIVKIHPLYQRRYNIKRKYLAHTEMEIKKGDKVIISQTRPISKKKAWKVIK